MCIICIRDPILSLYLKRDEFDDVLIYYWEFLYLDHCLLISVMAIESKNQLIVSQIYRFLILKFYYYFVL